MFFCCGFKPQIAKQICIRDVSTATKYGITIERYYRILALPKMTRGTMEAMYVNGWDFTDVSKDLGLFSLVQSTDLSSIPEYVGEDDQ